MVSCGCFSDCGFERDWGRILKSEIGVGYWGRRVVSFSVRRASPDSEIAAGLHLDVGTSDCRALTGGKDGLQGIRVFALLRGVGSVLMFLRACAWGKRRLKGRFGETWSMLWKFSAIVFSGVDMRDGHG